LIYVCASEKGEYLGVESNHSLDGSISRETHTERGRFGTCARSSERVPESSRLQGRSSERVPTWHGCKVGQASAYRLGTATSSVKRARTDLARLQGRSSERVPTWHGYKFGQASAYRLGTAARSVKRARTDLARLRGKGERGSVRRARFGTSARAGVRVPTWHGCAVRRARKVLRDVPESARLRGRASVTRARRERHARVGNGMLI
jgi:hypothetical protein